MSLNLAGVNFTAENVEHAVLQFYQSKATQVCCKQIVSVISLLTYDHGQSKLKYRYILKEFLGNIFKNEFR